MTVTDLTKITQILLWTISLTYSECYTLVLHTHGCANKPMNNGAGYSPHDTDCDKFIQCHYNGKGVIVGHIQVCAFSTFWNDVKLTCTPASETYCPTDKCQGQVNRMQYKGEGNCRGYWSCMDNKSVALCCPSGQYYNDTLGCVDTEDAQKCVDLCFNDISKQETEVDPESSEPEAPPCDTRPIVGNPYGYKVKAAGMITVTMKCPMGTVYSYAMCGCIHNPNKTPINKCRRELHLTFDTNGSDQSGNHNHVLNENVSIENGVAKFNGNNSRLTIPRFSNMDTIESLLIRVKYFSRHTKSGHSRPLISNSDCLNVPSILLAEDDINTYYGVGTTERNFIYTHIPQHHSRDSSKMEEKKLVYKFANGKLESSDGYSVKVQEAPGFIRNTHCALHVGYAESFEPFEGAIDELEVYICDPDGNT